MIPIVNVSFIYTGSFVTELRLRVSNSGGEPQGTHIVPVKYTEEAHVCFLSLVEDINSALERSYPVTYVVVNSDGFATIYEDDFRGLVSDWLDN